MNKQTNKQIVIVLAADLNYSEQIITLVKSICYHHNNVKIYLFNKDFPNEWFQSLNRYLNKINCQIVDVKVITDIFDHIVLLERITSAALYRYFIPELVDERVLYLDCDIIIDGDITEFYQLDFDGRLAAAIPDVILNDRRFENNLPDIKSYFNSGVLLINNTKWKELDIMSKLVNLTKENPTYKLLDQDILNIVLKDKWIPVHKRYNYQLAAKLVYQQSNFLDDLPFIENIEKDNPIILHYTDIVKPWLNIEPSLKISLRERYWFYYQLEWSDIIRRHIV